METAAAVVDHLIAVRGDQRGRSQRMHGPERDVLMGDAVDSAAQRRNYGPHELPPNLTLSNLSRVPRRVVTYITGDAHSVPVPPGVSPTRQQVVGSLDKL